jgi:hypothetical protein
MTNPAAADTMRMVFARRSPTLAAATPVTPAQRAGLMGGSHRITTTRYVLNNPAVADLDHDQLIAWAETP